MVLKKLLSSKGTTYYVLGVYVQNEFIALTYDKNTILIYLLAKGRELPTELGEYNV